MQSSEKCSEEEIPEININEKEKKKGKRKKMVQIVDTEKTIAETNKKKTKGAKIIDCLIPAVTYVPAKMNNVILHLKCTIQDIDEYIYKSNKTFNNLSYNPNIPTDIIAYDNNPLNKQFGDYTSSPIIIEIPTNSNVTSLTTNEKVVNESTIMKNVCIKCQLPSDSTSNILSEQDQQKIKLLKIQFYKNEMQDKKADCFWCTCPFDNEPCYILQYGYNNDIYGHGSFCSPECGVAYLFGKQQLWDDSAKTESFQLMNYYYGKPNGYQQSIKPALSPYYFLDKYYGNLTIQEYRRLTKSQHMMLIVEKPITRILPEIHEDNDNLFVGGGNNYMNCGKYKVKKQSEKPVGVSRNTILREQFGLSAK